jgi:hypothetical protein
MSKFEKILKHFPLKKRESRKIKKIIIKTEKNAEKTKNAKQNVNS